MKTFKFFAVVIAAFAMLVACEQQQPDPGTNNGGNTPDTPAVENPDTPKVETPKVVIELPWGGDVTEVMKAMGDMDKWLCGENTMNYEVLLSDLEEDLENGRLDQSDCVEAPDKRKPEEQQTNEGAKGFLKGVIHGIFGKK